MKRFRFSVARVVVGSALVMMLGAYGCALNPFASISYEEAQTMLAGPSSSSNTGGAGGVGGMGGAAGSGGAPCMCADDKNECTEDVIGECPGGDKAACHSVTVGATCSKGACNTNGICVDCLTCDAPECKARCNGIACSDDGMCKTKNCEQAVCCDQECLGPCKSCNREGTPGTCTRMPKGLAVCASGKLCDNMGECIADLKVALGGLCSIGSECASGLCRRQYCQSPVGEPCVERLECTTNLCDPMTHTCKACIGPDAAPCPAGSDCDETFGRCKVMPGEPAGGNEECMRGETSPHRCLLQPGDTCTRHDECVYRNCLGNGVCAGPCMSAGECAAGTGCIGDVCKLATGGYCMQNTECQSGKCTGFPRRCE